MKPRHLLRMTMIVVLILFVASIWADDHMAIAGKLATTAVCVLAIGALVALIDWIAEG